jgi:hypothetical protein
VQPSMQLEKNSLKSTQSMASLAMRPSRSCYSSGRPRLVLCAAAATTVGVEPPYSSETQPIPPVRPTHITSSPPHILCNKSACNPRQGSLLSRIKFNALPGGTLGQGANSALLDVVEFDRCLEASADNVTEAVALFSSKQVSLRICDEYVVFFVFLFFIWFGSFFICVTFPLSVYRLSVY